MRGKRSEEEDEFSEQESAEESHGVDSIFGDNVPGLLSRDEELRKLLLLLSLHKTRIKLSRVGFDGAEATTGRNLPDYYRGPRARSPLLNVISTGHCPNTQR